MSAYTAGKGKRHGAQVHPTHNTLAVVQIGQSIPQQETHEMNKKTKTCNSLSRRQFGVRGQRSLLEGKTALVRTRAQSVGLEGLCESAGELVLVGGYELEPHGNLWLLTLGFHSHLLLPR